ncbi:MAG: peptidoglycan DD-metalloendopeptidase family protein [Alphaproteobacteria bacterium]
MSVSKGSERLKRISAIIQHLYPEREIFLRSRGRVRYLTLPQSVQITLTGIMAALFGWLGVATALYVSNHGVIEAKEAEIDTQQLVLERIVRDVADRQAQVATLTTKLKENQATLLESLRQQRGATANTGLSQALNAVLVRINHDLIGMEEAGTGLESIVTQVRDRLDIEFSTRGRIANARRELWNRLREAQAQLKDESGRTKSLENDLSALNERMDVLSEDKGRATAEKEWYRQRIQGLENELSELRDTQGSVLSRLAEKANQQIEEAEEIVALTGLDADDLLARQGVLPIGQGGPFVAATTASATMGDQFNSTVALLDLHLDRWEGLQQILKSLPLSAPIDNSYITSGFGQRLDPFTKKLARHDGVDFAGRYKTPIFAPAPGEVVFAGRRGGYGKMVEIDHGYGVHTRYGHLGTILVKVGDKIRYRDEVGLMGNTGRSTGAHLHWEVMINGHAIDPLHFLNAGRYLAKSRPEATAAAHVPLPRPRPDTLPMSDG